MKGLYIGEDNKNYKYGNIYNELTFGGDNFIIINDNIDAETAKKIYKVKKEIRAKEICDTLEKELKQNIFRGEEIFVFSKNEHRDWSEYDWGKVKEWMEEKKKMGFEIKLGPEWFHIKW